MKKLTVLFTILILSGCSSIMSHTQPDGFCHPFSGVLQSVKNQPCWFMLYAHAWFSPYPIVIADIPISLASDIILLPLDLVLLSEPSEMYSNVRYIPPSECRAS